MDESNHGMRDKDDREMESKGYGIGRRGDGRTNADGREKTIVNPMVGLRDWFGSIWVLTCCPGG